jgi:hypothetical protein
VPTRAPPTQQAGVPDGASRTPSTSPCRAQRRSREHGLWGRSAPRSAPARAREERRVGAAAAAERKGFEPLVPLRVRLIGDAPTVQCSALRACALPASPKFRARVRSGRCARNGGGRRFQSAAPTATAVSSAQWKRAPLSKVEPMRRRRRAVHRRYRSACLVGDRGGSYVGNVTELSTATRRNATTSPSRTPSGVTKRVAQRRSREHALPRPRGRSAARSGRRPRAPTGASATHRLTAGGQRRRERDSNPWYPYGYA